MGIKLESLLHTEMADEFDALSKMDKGSEPHKTMVDGLVKLLDKAIEIDKLNNEHEEKIREQKFENDLKLKQFEEDKKDRLIKNCLTGAGILLPLGVTIWGTLKSIKFEETGTITTIMGRGFIQKLLPKGK